MQVLGLAHYSRVGKDSLANAIVTSVQELSPQTRIKKMSFAWKLKGICYDLYAWAGMKPPSWYETPEGEKDRDIVLSAIGKTPVEIWVAMGTPAVREQVYERTWIDYLLKSDLGLDAVVIPDCRFPNEVQAIRDAGGKLVKVVRPGYGPRNTVADLALKDYTDWDYVVGSSGRMSELEMWGYLFAKGLVTGEWPIQTCADKEVALSVERSV